MVRPRTRPPPIDIIAAASAMSSASFAPSSACSITAISSYPDLSYPSKTSGLIQILPPQCHMPDHLEAIHELNASLYRGPSRISSHQESISSSPSSFTNSNRHTSPPTSLPSSPALTISPVSPAFASDFAHITFSDMDFESDSSTSTFTFIPVPWVSSSCSYHAGDENMEKASGGLSSDAKYKQRMSISLSSEMTKEKVPSSAPSSAAKWSPPVTPSFLLAPVISNPSILLASPFDWPPPPSPTIPCSPLESYSPYPSPLLSPQHQSYGDYLTAEDLSSFLSEFPMPPLDRPRPRPTHMPYPRSPRSPRPLSERRGRDENSYPLPSRRRELSLSRGRTLNRQSRASNRRARIVS